MEIVPLGNVLETLERDVLGTFWGPISADWDRSKLPKHFWIGHWVDIYLIFAWRKFWYFKKFCGPYKNKSAQNQLVITLKIAYFWNEMNPCSTKNTFDQKKILLKEMDHSIDAQNFNL